jgi:hypothetical protein
MVALSGVCPLRFIHVVDDDVPPAFAGAYTSNSTAIYTEPSRESGATVGATSDFANHLLGQLGVAMV